MEKHAIKDTAKNLLLTIVAYYLNGASTIVAITFIAWTFNYKPVFAFLVYPSFSYSMTVITALEVCIMARYNIKISIKDIALNAALIACATTLTVVFITLFK